MTNCYAMVSSGCQKRLPIWRFGNFVIKILLLERFYDNLVRLEEDLLAHYQIGIDNNINLENLAAANVSESKQLKEI